MDLILFFMRLKILNFRFIFQSSFVQIEKKKYYDFFVIKQYCNLKMF